MPQPLETYIALFRGINISGRHIVPMAALKALFEKDGCVDVRTYIQSGNIVFRRTPADAAAQAAKFASLVGREFGFEPQVFVLTQKALLAAAAANPFSEADDDPKSVHLFFLGARPKKACLVSCESIRARTERFALKGSVFYLHTPDGFGVSALASRAEKLLGVTATARNWRTVTALCKLSQ